MEPKRELSLWQRARLYAQVWYRATRDAHREGGAFWAAVVAVVTPLFLCSVGLPAPQLVESFEPAAED